MSIGSVIKKITIYNDGIVDVEEYRKGEYDELRQAAVNNPSTLPPDENKFDEQGRLVETISYLPHVEDFPSAGSSAKYDRLLYRYSDHDEHGNWLSSLNYSLDENGTEHSLGSTRREIEYY